MTTNTELVQTLYAAFGRGDLKTILDNCAPDIAWVSNGDPKTIPWTGARSGHDGATAFFAALAGAVDFEAFEPRQFFPSGDTTIVLGFTRARHKTGGRAAFDSEWVHVFTIGNGKLTRFQEFYDTAAIEHALAA